MACTPAQSPWSTAAGVAALHALRSQDELEREFAGMLAVFLPDVPIALCLAEHDTRQVVRFTLGADCPLTPLAEVDADSWPLPAEQRLPVRYYEHLLGELLVGVSIDAATRGALEDILVHFGTALVNLALNSEARKATDDYCATLQALEEGIVLFQEEDPEAVMARLLALASSMVNATAGALYVFDEIGQRDSGLSLQQALGMPEALLASFTAADGSAWPDCLVDGPAGIVERDRDGGIAGLAPDCTPAVLKEVVVLPLRYHGVQAGICLLFNPKIDPDKTRENVGRLQSFGQLAAALLHRLHLERLRENSVSIQRELQIAETIQKRLVPSQGPSNDDYEFAW
ncbi:MAG TPA: hypothetical protein ENI87_09670, partial [bacterium]|nr:hypothetical protein [bacterium]